MLTDRPGLTAGTTAGPAAEHLFFPSVSLSILLCYLTLCLFSLSFFLSLSHPAFYFFLSHAFVYHIPLSSYVLLHISWSSTASAVCLQ